MCVPVGEWAGRSCEVWVVMEASTPADQRRVSRYGLWRLAIVTIDLGIEFA